MSTLGNFALASASYHGVNNAYRKACLLQVVLTSDGTTVSVNTARSAPGFTITTGANGALTGTCPKASRGVAWSQGLSATASDVLVANFSALSPTAGTFALQVHNDGSETILASGDELWLFFWLEGG
jgi:hypothetical protein